MRFLIFLIFFLTFFTVRNFETVCQDSQSEISCANDIIKSIVRIDVYFPHLDYLLFNSKSLHIFGSGFFVKDNIIMTCAHVISMDGFVSPNIVIKTYDGSVFKAEVIFCDLYLDIALIQIKGRKFNPVNFSKVHLMPNDAVYAISCHDEKWTTTDGIVSSQFCSCADVDYAIYKSTNPIFSGSSGAPLIRDNEVIGMVFGNFEQGATLSIPVWLLQYVMKHVLAEGNCDVPWMKIDVDTADIDVLKFFNLKHGVQVSSSFSDVFLPGDVILEVNQREMKSKSDLFEVILFQKPGDLVDVHFLRCNESGKTISYNVKVHIHAREKPIAIFKRIGDMVFGQNEHGVFLCHVYDVVKLGSNIYNVLKCYKNGGIPRVISVNSMSINSIEQLNQIYNKSSKLLMMLSIKGNTIPIVVER
ncbi:S1C family serine protease [Candidatus Gromoviella agglomerans]|uniref:S1C family serine protease n=1 Tax=Candidatus Gromoviella agglomerans TaxID=2806609 RepID=UPI001E302125|nr:trypsin-like peptidase domain-containing protein [Candidatus Gromoviella agglomerans]UFX98375.1 Do/DeqQ family serine endopeptidase protein [Candidatus Gromoviella agglomerans]